MRRLALSLTAALAATACAAVGPDYTAPANTVGQAPFVSAAAPLFAAQEPPADWWRLYQSPAIDALVAQALANNRDIAVAAANLAQVRASLAETRTLRLPSTTLSGGALAARQPNPVTATMVNGETVSTGFDVAYEVDLFGRNRRSIEAATADSDAAAAALDVVRVTVAAETTRAFADACAANLQLASAQRSRALLTDTAALTRRQLDAGRGTGLDVARAEAQGQTVAASLPPLEAARDAALFRLAVLTGREPASVSAEARACATPPVVASVIPVGDGAGLLRRRPDVRQAERRLAAATARIGVATADLYPSVTLGGALSTIGGSGQDFGDLQFSAGPLIRWTFPNRAAGRARIDQADAAAQGALAAFEQTTLIALQETETALSAYARALDRQSALLRAREEGARAVTLSRMRFEGGLDSFLTVLDADRTLADLEAQYAQSQGEVATRQIELFKALGGGWTEARTG